MTRRSTSKVKVETSKLLEAVKARRDDALDNHEKAARLFDKQVETYRKEIAKAVKAYLSTIDTLDADELPAMGFNKRLQIEISSQVHRPQRPRINIEDLNRLIKTLEIAAEDTITISADDAAQYLG